jgi:hypothetical protein
MGAPTSVGAILRRRPILVWREIHWPAELPAETAVTVLRQLATDRFVFLVVLEVESDAGLLFWRIGVPAEATTRVEQMVASLLPDGAVSRAVRRPLSSAWRVKLSARHRPLVTTGPEPVSRALLAALASADKGERIVVQWLLGTSRGPQTIPPDASSTFIDPWWRLLLGTSNPLDADERHALQAKRSTHGFGCIGRVAVEASSPNRARALAVSVLAGLRSAEAPGVSVGLVRETPERFNVPGPLWRWPYSLNLLELVGLLGWPLGDQPLPGVPRTRSRWLRPDPRVVSRRRVVGASSAPGEAVTVGLGIDDARQHLHVIGPTGTGKSTLLANLILQDIRANRSVVVIEPKGDLVADVLARLPVERVDDVVVIDPTETEFPVGLNPLLARGRSPELVADQVLAVFHGLWANNWGPRLQDILHSSLLTLAGSGEASLCLLPALLTNPGLRSRLRSHVDDPIALEPFWAWFDSISDAERQQAIAPVLNKLRPFLLRRTVRTIVGQLEPRFRIDEVFTGRKIALVSLAKGRMGPESAALLGSLFVAELWQAVLGRASVAPERRHPVVVYADEFQDYVHLPTDMADALAQARGLGVGLVLAHQHLSQLPASVKAAVLANARSRVCFQLAGDDAQTMARLSAGQLEATDFQRLSRFEAYAQLVAGGEVTGLASIQTAPLPGCTIDPETVRASSRARYGRPAIEVERAIARLLEGDVVSDAPAGRRRARR